MSKQFIVSLTLLVITGFTIAAIAADENPPPKGDYESGAWGTVTGNYPGRNEDDTRILNVAQFQVQIGLQYYYKLTGEWPDSWQTVEDKLLFQVPIYSFSGKVIDPDDSSGGFIGDLYYDAYSTAISERGEAHIREMNFLSGPFTVLTHVKQVPTYAEQFPKADAAGGIDYFSTILQDDHMLQYMALLGVIANSIRTYDILHGHPPYSWDEFLDCGMSPIDRDSINPMTGEPFEFSGGSYDIRYEYMEKSKAFFFTHLDDNGEIPTYGFTY